MNSEGQDPRGVTVERESEFYLDEAVSNIFGIAVRRRWWIVLASSAVVLGVLAWVSSLPNVYKSDVKILALRQQLSRRILNQDPTMSVADQVSALANQVLSKASLLGIIDDLNLYPRERDGQTPDQLIARLQSNITTDPIMPNRDGEFTALLISFQASDPKIARDVTNRLAYLFVEENTKTRTRQTKNASTFLAQEVAAAQAKLEGQEARLRSFRMKNLGELPEQQQVTLQALTDLRLQQQAITTSLTQAAQRRNSLELSLNERLGRAQLERSALLAKYTPKHKDVIAKDREVGLIKELLDGVQTTSANSKQLAQLAINDQALSQMRDQIDSARTETEALNRRATEIRNRITQAEEKLNATPIRDQELGELQRDYNLYKQEYLEIKNKQLQAAMSANLEEKDEGGQFRVADAPSLPTTPISPKRMRLSMAGWVGGLVLGIALAFLIEKLDSRVHAEAQVRRFIPAPLIVGIPMILTAGERRLKIGKIALECTAGLILFASIITIQYYVYSFAG